jgi:hypothetical protein
MGLVKAAHSPWKHSEGSDEETTVLRQEFEARLTELATHGFQAAEYAGSLVFARMPVVEDGEYTAQLIAQCTLAIRGAPLPPPRCLHPGPTTAINAAPPGA